MRFDASPRPELADQVLDALLAALPGQILLSEHYASTLRNFDGWAVRIESLGTHTVKHRLKLRLCELVHPHAPRRSPLATSMRQELPAVPWVLKWIGLLLFLGILGGALHTLIARLIEAQAASEAAEARLDPPQESLYQQGKKGEPW